MLNISMLTLCSESLPLTSSHAILNGSKFEKISQTLWHVAFNPGRCLSLVQTALITYKEKNIWYNQKWGILQEQ